VKREGYLSVWIIILLLIPSLIAGCGSSNTIKKENAAEEKEKLVFRITWKTYSGRGEAIQRIVNKYNAANKEDYEITMIDGDEDFTAIEGLLNEASPVDIYVLPYRFVKYFGCDNKLLDLKEDFEPEKNYIYQSIWELGIVEGKVYGIPWVGHSICLVYNKNILKEAGINPLDIKSIEDLADACEKVEANTEAKGIGLVGANHNDVSWMVNQFIYGFGSSLVDKTGNTVAVNNDKSKKAIDFYKNTLGKYAQNTWVNDTGIEVMDYFRRQQVAFEFQGVWGVTDIWKNGNPFEVGVISLSDIGLNAEVGPMMLALPAKLSNERREAAKNFIRFLISKEAQETIMNGEYSPEHDSYYPFRIPVRTDLISSSYFEEHPEFIPFLEGLKNPSIDVPVPKWQQIKDQYFAPGLNEVMSDNLSIDEFLKLIETEGNLILQK